MEDLRIFVIISHMPEEISVITLFLKNLTDYLKTKRKVKMVWLVSQPEKILHVSQEDSEDIILDIHDFDNAVDAMKQTKPHLVYCEEPYEFRHYASLIAAKFLKIPVFGGYGAKIPIEIQQKNMILNYAKRFFQNTVPTEKNGKKQLMRRGRYFFYKYNFLVNTQKVAGQNYKKIISDFFMFLKNFLRPNSFEMSASHVPIDKRFACDLHWVENKKLCDILIKEGYDKNTLFVTGDPKYDHTNKKIKSIKNKKKSNEKIKVLFATTNLYEHGFWNKDKRDYFIQNIVTEITKHKDNLSLKIKIHPTNENIQEYQKIVNKIDPSIQIIQKGEFLEQLDDTDIVVTFPAGASVCTYTTIARIPLMICNFFDDKWLFLEKEIATECKDPANLMQNIEDALKINPQLSKNIEAFIEESIYKEDGLASQRFGDALINYLENNKNF